LQIDVGSAVHLKSPSAPLLLVVLSILLMSTSTFSIGVIISNVVFSSDKVYEGLYVCFNGSHIYVIQDENPFMLVYAIDGRLIHRLFIGEEPLRCITYGSIYM